MKFEKAKINSTVAKLTTFFDSPEELKKYVDEKEIHSFLIWNRNDFYWNNYVVGVLRRADDGSWLAYINSEEVPVSFDTYITDLLEKYKNLNLCYKGFTETIDKLMEA